MLCSKCGSEVNIDDMFCSKCGVSIELNQPHKKVKKQMRKNETAVKTLILALDDIINDDEKVKKDQVSDRFSNTCKKLGVTGSRQY